MSDKFESLNGYLNEHIGDAPFEIAKIFSSMAKETKEGWHTGTIAYKIDANGNVILIDGIKVTYTGETDLKGISR